MFAAATAAPAAPADSRSWPRRPALALLALALLALLVAAMARDLGPWWHVAAFAAAPDLALLLGISSGLAPGQLHPRAVPAYNALHRFWGPALLTPLLPVAGLAWALHVAFDRAVGFGLRTRDGH